MKTIFAAAAAATLFAAPAMADELYDACVGVLETVELPEGATVESMKPNCQCVVDNATDDAVRANLLEGAALPEEEREAFTSPEAQAVVATCFPVPEDAG